MPDHLHLLVEGTTDISDLQEFVRGWKQRSAYTAKRRGVILWQRGYYDHVLRNDESTERTAAYVLGNPVRAGLAARPEEYPFLGSFVATIEDLLVRAQERVELRGRP